MKFNLIKFLWGKEVTLMNGLCYWTFVVSLFSPGIVIALLLLEVFNIPEGVAISISILYSIFHLIFLAKLIEKEQDEAVERALFHRRLTQDKQGQLKK